MTAACVSVSAATEAQDAGASSHEDYESAQVYQALARHGFRVDPMPEGKRIVSIYVDRHEVFESGEAWPDFMVIANALHGLTEEAVVQREFLFQEGDAYSSTAIEETMRNLRALQIFSLVRIEAVQRDNPDQVALFVYTRDLWSLRLETEFAGVGPSLRALAAITERNFLGKNKSVGVRMAYRPINLSFGQSYRDYRMFGERFELRESGDVYYNYRDDRFEGGFLAATFGRPFYRLDQEFAFDVYAGYQSWMHRDLGGIQAAVVNLDTGEIGGCDPALPSCARSVYRERTGSVVAAGHYRFGEYFKHTFSLGAGYYDKTVKARAESSVGDGYEDEFDRLVLPIQRRSVYPFVRHRVFSIDYQKFRNLGSYAVTETVRTGPALDTTLRLPMHGLGSTYDAFRFDTEFTLVWADDDALVDLKAAFGGRAEQSELREQLIAVRLRGATPPFLLGRLVLSGEWERRKNDTSRTYVSLGADNGLRGYSAAAFGAYGASRLRMNFEYRTLPLDLDSVHLGAVLFFDSGTVYNGGADPFTLRYSTGVGVRMLLPQFNVVPFRLDVGVPVGESGFSVVLSYGSLNAVPITATEDLYLENSFQSL